jgi:phosphoribosyl 1,2-cyclic phosphodiesterase
MAEQRFLVRFWGVRGSYPTTGAHTLRHGGNTSCVEIQVGHDQGHTLIFDAGSGIIRLGETLMAESKQSQNGYNGHTECTLHKPGYGQEGVLDISLFITHGHGDHLVGFPFFAPLFDPQTNLHVFGPQLADHSIEHVVTQLMAPPYFPVDVRSLPSQRTFHTIEDEQCISWDDSLAKSNGPSIAMLPHRMKREEVCVAAKFTQSHPLDGAVIYRIEYAGRCVVYATDVEWQQGCEDAFVEFVQGADVLIHDAQYTAVDYERLKRGFGHSTIEMAVAAARAGHVGELILFHHEPVYDDDQLDRMEAEARNQFAHSRSAYEGMEIDLLAQRV